MEDLIDAIRIIFSDREPDEARTLVLALVDDFAADPNLDVDLWVTEHL